MARTKPPLLALHELVPDQSGDCFVLLAEKQRSLTQSGKPYFTCRFADCQRTVTTMVWSDSPLFEKCEREWQPYRFYKIRGTYREHERYGHQFELIQIRPVNEGDSQEGFDEATLVEHSRWPREQMWRDLLELAQTQIVDEPLRRLVCTLLDQHAERLQRLPASQGRYYTFVGGLLEHTLAVTRSCVWLAQRYADYYKELRPSLNRDVVIAAALLHELGRVAEFGEDNLGRELSIPGRLLGAQLLGRDLVRAAARAQGDLNPELLGLLEHVLVSYLALPEWGSPRLPLIPEVLILHHADDLDAKLEMYIRCLTRDQAAGPFTERDPALGRSLLKSRTI